MNGSLALPRPTFSLLANPRARRGGGIRSEAFRGGLPAIDSALHEIRSWPDYHPTPLHDLTGLAQHVQLGQLRLKDEGHRFGVGSFKPMGGGYAVSRILAREVMQVAGAARTGPRELLAGEFADIVSRVTVACATDGNHGRAVAWAARTFGCRAVVYLASHVSESREETIRSFGADVVRTSGNHDDAVRQVAADAGAAGWFVVSQTASATSPEIAHDIFLGYGALFHEMVNQLPHGVTPSHVFVQCGVGGLAASCMAYAELRWGGDRPVIVVVEAENAACAFRSVAAGEPVAIEGDLATLMGGLAAGEISPHVWPTLDAGADYCMTIPDEAAIDTMRCLAAMNPPIAIGEAGVASLAAALTAAQAPHARELMGLTGQSRVLTIGTEGATDPGAYAEIVGLSCP
ncbi:MAG: diaminopropionate ammonia-lyase [Gemmatimonadetes bacterium]|nr:diaminopropionate ammonia-lyase [Gemmatimonadota bacterium]